MAERYWITGVQLAMLRLADTALSSEEKAEILKEIEDNQFIGRIEEFERDKKKVDIVEADKK